MATASFEREIIITDEKVINIIKQDLNDSDPTPNFKVSDITKDAEANGDRLLAKFL